MKRRNFLDILLNFSLFAWIGAIIYPVLKFLNPPATQDVSINSISVGEVTEFPVNSSIITRFGRKPVIVIRKKNGDFRALAATCTHLDCNVQYKTDTEQIWCACHNGYYNVEGKNISGPPPKPLPQYQVNIVESKIIISKEDLS